MKKRILATLVLLILTSCSNQPKSVEEYQASIDYSCSTDSDCIKKNVGNCCGFFPKCVNKNFEPNKGLLKELCKEENAFSICGYPEITSCKCTNNKCEALQ